MVKFKGRSSLKQYLPMKSIKRVFKIWAICDSMTGHALGLKKKTMLTAYLWVIMDLVEVFQNKGAGFQAAEQYKGRIINKGEHDFVPAEDITIVKWEDRSAKPVCVISSIPSVSKCCVLKRMAQGKVFCALKPLPPRLPVLYLH
ncbi:hypothetical protein J437_LFUL011427 [Ladona fulva]|uniref:Uncharacterized protein n=1 Tax=Ladona fulva TaxID=123851 RepID=A0A8K0KM46_LADFU|nr:hypothetical protein J437_LFUL011427 [Ladona fulva]